MIFDSKAQDLFREFREADKANQAVIVEFDRLLQAGNVDEATAEEFTRRIEETNERRNDLFDQLQKFRLDK